MAEKKAEELEEFVDYEETVEPTPSKNEADQSVKKGSYVGIHTTGFRDMILKPEIMRAIVDCGFEHPSEVQQQCIPQAILGKDVLCQAKSGMGKTAVFVIATLQQFESDESKLKKEVQVLVLGHTRELAYQIMKEYQRLSKYMPYIKTDYFCGGQPKDENVAVIKKGPPHIVVGTPGRILQLVEEGHLNLKNLKHFVVDECDNVLEKLDMRKDVQSIFKATPYAKQVLMFTATLSKEIHPVCLKFMHKPLEILIDEEKKLTLHGLQQHYVNVTEAEKNRKLCDLLDALEFNQVVIFVKSVARAGALNKLLTDCNFPSSCIHSGMKQEERLERYKEFKDFKKRIMVATDIFGRGIDIERVNIVINYDMPPSSDAYLHRVGRAGRFGTKGLAITFATKEDEGVLAQVQSRFEVSITELPDEIDVSSYMS